MAKFLSRARLIAYMPGLEALRATVVSQRSFSHSIQQYNRGEESQSEVTTWPDKKLGPLSVQDKRFPLPGNVGTAAQLLPQQRPEVASSHANCDVLYKPLPHDRHAAVFAQFINTVSESEESAEDFMKEAYKNPKNVLEMIAQDCPKSLIKGFSDLFPDIDLSKGSITILTLCQKTKNDMSTWSPEVEHEREELLENFMTSAVEICKLLTEAGFWADFIDPSSGQAFVGASNPNSTLFETDERFTKLGFDIEDLGCCKCIRHRDWGMHIFVGTLFTTAPPDCDKMKEIMFNGMA
ncbi:methylmalonic aciduria and homocystinuria type D homolog, mitochondrial-like isoform X2 [Anneissia japonica]|uniref:methylmalonic aciduria and homocystinuria type D homolog, mitochondrial-like isoform X1 n=1 Tax=Anneissia japonica TaxID=1529436 RepID=UPI0014254C3A|nr:methylmalonic aciduria and homocystinuria type D homolog, mitochondrial-like isoform X1 [Anneissia japonica]XP_033118240.1 methylmalonic aciduria and homocystinuria type D homolog, mitochondrial-like isoform X1 [Anneissia japonica]XP_033118241.1 methylmalonic aciduria and homocystinuria type D homolog, mitochondrial-like isoform X2 [Anneissia japonica]